MIQSLFPFELENRHFLIEASLVREVLGETAWLPLPRAPAALPGVIAWNGRAIAVLDLTVVFHLPSPSEKKTRHRTLITQVGEEILALPVDEAQEVVRIASQDLQEPHALPTPFSTAEHQLNQRISTVIDLRAITQQFLSLPSDPATLSSWA